MRKKIALISDQNESEKLANCDNKQLNEKYNYKSLFFQNMLFENVGQGRSMTPVIPNKMEEAKVPRVNTITEVDLDDDEAPPSTPCLMREIQHVLDQDVARSVTHKPMTEVRIFDLEVEAPEN